MRSLIGLVDRRYAGRFHPMTRYGFNTMVEGSRQGSDLRTAAGLALMLVGITLRRPRRPRRKIFSAELEAGQAIGIRVIERGKVVGEFEIPGSVS